jgi:hypothetical protein
MGWWVVMQVLSTLIEWIRIGRFFERNTDTTSAAQGFPALSGNPPGIVEAVPV